MKFFIHIFIMEKYALFFKLYSQEELAQVLSPIEHYLKEIKKKKYIFFPKTKILIDNSSSITTISNFGQSFFFHINLNHFKKIKIFEDNTVYYFWTFDNEFTKYYFQEYAKKRICIKDGNRLKSIDLDDIYDINYDKFYFTPKKVFNCKEKIESLINLDWFNPPEELYFILSCKNFNGDKIEPLYIGTETNKTFFHCPKIGVTVRIISAIKIDLINKLRIFYFNTNILYNIKTHLSNYEI